MRQCVLPLTREWIEIYQRSQHSKRRWNGSPSHEGVDWNYLSGSCQCPNRSVLPLTREWIEIVFRELLRQFRQFSLSRGSGLKFFRDRKITCVVRSPSHEGVDWNTPFLLAHSNSSVLPLTREWIEIDFCTRNFYFCCSSPSHEGVDWNRYYEDNPEPPTPFSLSRGSGLKYLKEVPDNNRFCVLPLTREWIEMDKNGEKNGGFMAFSLSRGSGLKSLKISRCVVFVRSPSHEGVDWNQLKMAEYARADAFSLSRGSGLKLFSIGVFFAVNRSPSHEGVDWNILLFSFVHNLRCSPSHEGVDWNEP